jgi:hypothetical protein
MGVRGRSVVTLSGRNLLMETVPAAKINARNPAVKGLWG